MFGSLLIANRGEIAVRIGRTAREMGIKTIAIYSDADRRAMHVEEADTAVRIGPAPAGESYLRGDAVIEAALRTGAEAIHPGYGFLSENAEFADACATAGIVFVGPPADAIRAMGLKDRAKALMASAGVPVVPGYHGPEQDPHFLAGEAQAIGYPLLIKAAAGGGGKGMRKVETASDFDAALSAARREAMAAFGDDRVLIEKFVETPRHVEIQVFADQYGNAVSLYERDCSLQRRHQKVVEEAPAPGMPPEMRAAMGKAAVKAALAIGYVGAGTVEFIADGRDGLRPDRFFFMEMNTRLQVEHPVTEAITGVDLVRWQLEVAAGGTLPRSQEQIPLDGHAVEVRLYAEDPTNQFLPSTGRLTRLRMPRRHSQIRTDMGVREGDDITGFYDPMIGKIIAHGQSRSEALGVLGNFLSGMEIVGPQTNAAFLERVVTSDGFRAAELDTGFIDRHFDELVPQCDLSNEVVALATAGHLAARAAARVAKQRSTTEPHSPWASSDGWSLGGPRREALRFEVDGRPVELTTKQTKAELHCWFDSDEALNLTTYLEPDDRLTGEIDGQRISAAFLPDRNGFALVHAGIAYQFSLTDPLAVEEDSEGPVVSATAPMPGRIIDVAVRPGDTVEKGAALVVMEAMKMEHTVTASADTVVATVNVAVGDQVERGALLIAFEE